MGSKKKEEHKFDDAALDKMEKKQFERKNIWNDNCPYFKFSQLKIMRLSWQNWSISMV